MHVQALLKDLDPEGKKLRKAERLTRRKYSNPGPNRSALGTIAWGRPEWSAFSDCTSDVAFRWHFSSFGNEHGGDYVEFIPWNTARIFFRIESFKLSSIQEFFGWWNSWIMTSFIGDKYHVSQNLHRRKEKCCPTSPDVTSSNSHLGEFIT